MAKKKSDEEPEVEESREDKLASLFHVARKKWGENVVGYAKDFKFKNIPRISSGVLPLDYAMGGGFPVGRISMTYGHKSSSKTTLFLRAIGNAQKQCSACWTIIRECEGSTAPKCECGDNRKTVIAWLDVEGCWNDEWARNYCNPDEVILSQPDTAEQTIDLADSYVRSGVVDIIVIDSIAFMTAATEIEKSATEQTMGVQARLIGVQMRKFVSGFNSLAQSDGRKPTVFLINQIRNKMVMFGCFHGDTLISFADGRQIPIRNVVQQKMTGKVLSYNKETRQIEEKNIINWFNNGKIDPANSEYWLHILTTGAGGPNGRMGFTCTTNHTLYRVDGTEVPAGDVVEGETLLSYREDRIFPATILSVGVASAKKHRDLVKYDLQIEDNSTYLVGGGHRGIVVHNSPDVVPGGLAQGFATSLEVHCYSNNKYDMDDVTGKPISQELRFRIDKNKVGPARIEGEYRLILSNTETKKVGDVIDEGWALSMGEKAGLITIAGQMVTCNGLTYRGKSTLEKFWTQNKKEYQEFKEKLLPVLLTL